jgi:hypothetical protein
METLTDLLASHFLEPIDVLSVLENHNWTLADLLTLH